MQMLLVHETLRSLFLSRIFTQYLDLLETKYLKIECTKTKQPALTFTVFYINYHSVCKTLK